MADNIIGYENIDLSEFNKLMSKGGYDKTLDPKVTRFDAYNQSSATGDNGINLQIQREINKHLPADKRILEDGKWGEQTNSAAMFLRNLGRLNVDSKPVVAPVEKPTYEGVADEQPMSFDAYANRYQLNPIMAEFEKLKPKREQDTERMRKIAMAQAIGSGLRNIIDLSFAGRGGDAKVHNDHQYTLKMADRANELDDRYEQEDKAHNLRMLQEKLRQSDLYGRYIQGVDTRNADNKKAEAEFNNRIKIADWQNQENRRDKNDDRAFEVDMFGRRTNESRASQDREFGFRSKQSALDRQHEKDMLAAREQKDMQLAMLKIAAEREKAAKGGDIKTIPFTILGADGKGRYVGLTQNDANMVYNWASANTTMSDDDLAMFAAALKGDGTTAFVQQKAQQYIANYLSDPKNKWHSDMILGNDTNGSHAGYAAASAGAPTGYAWDFTGASSGAKNRGGFGNAPSDITQTAQYKAVYNEASKRLGKGASPREIAVLTNQLLSD